MAANLNKVLTGESKNLLLSQFSPMTGNYLFLDVCKTATCTSGSGLISKIQFTSAHLLKSVFQKKHSFSDRIQIN